MKTATLIACFAKQMLAAAACTARVVHVDVVILSIHRFFDEGFADFKAVDDYGVVFLLERRRVRDLQGRGCNGDSVLNL
jgi:hypothetical protein